MYECPNCGTEFERGTNFCPNCGLNLEEEFIYEPVCPLCKKNFPIGSKFCDVDGSRLVDSSKLIPKCTICGKEYDESVKFCPDDGGRVASEAELELERTMKERYENSAEQHHYETDFDALAKKGYTVNIWGWIAKGWELLKADLGLYVLLSIITFGLYSIPDVNTIFILLLGFVLESGFLYVAIKRLRGEVPSFRDLFVGFKQFVSLLLLQWVIGFFVFLGLILFVVPGIYLSVSYIFAILLVIDRKMDFWPAMEASRKVVTREWFSIFAFSLISMIISLLGLIAFYVGVIITMPFLNCALVAAYDGIFGIKREPAAVQIEGQSDSRSF